jgi:protein gp37
MRKKSGIEWTDRSDWNPIRGCTRVSEGCRNCYAETIAGRFSAPGQPFHGFATQTDNGGRWTGKVELIKERLALPLKWRKPATIFVNSAFDLFHEAIPDEVIDRVFAVMALAPQHTFQVLTKRAERMREYLTAPDTMPRIYDIVIDRVVLSGPKPLQSGGKPAVLLLHGMRPDYAPKGRKIDLGLWPLPNVWLGVSVEGQRRADERIPHLLATPAAVRWISAEPLLAPVSVLPYLFIYTHEDHEILTRTDDDSVPEIPWRDPATTPADDIATSRLDWVVVGGESGPGARPMHPDWARSIRDQCASAGVAFHFKQWGNWSPLQDDNGYWPADAPGHIRLGADGTRTDSGWPMQLVAKNVAGRLIDGIEHNGFPEVRS